MQNKMITEAAVVIWRSEAIPVVNSNWLFYTNEIMHQMVYGNIKSVF